MFELSQVCHAKQLEHACIYHIVVDFDKVHDKFPVMKKMHTTIKNLIKEHPIYVTYLKYQSKYWNSHAAIYAPPPTDGNLRKKL